MPLSTTINSAQTLEAAQKWVAEVWESKRWIKLSIHTSRRSLDANALSHVWYDQIGEYQGDSPEEVKDQCKLLYGVPILRRNEKKNKFFQAIGFDRFPHHAQLAAMKYINVTSLFSVEEMQEYLDTIQRVYAQNGLTLDSGGDRDAA